MTADAEKLLAWMRANGVVSARIGDVALVLGPEPTPPAAQLDDWDAPPKPRITNPEEDPVLYDGHNVPGFIPVE